MRFALLKEDVKTFRHEGEVEFEDLITPEERDFLIDELGEASEGRYLWRSHPLLKPLVCRRRLAEVAHRLTDSRSLRLGYDHLLLGGPGPLLSGKTLEEVSAFDRVVAGLILPFSTSGIFVAPDHPLQFDHPRALLLVYIVRKSHYIHNKGDPYIDEPKKWGYALNDRVREKDFPTVWR